MKKKTMVRRKNSTLADKDNSQGQWKQSLLAMKGMWADDDEAVQRMQEIRNEFDRLEINEEKY
jgi:hypothetical protein